jgi:hypothetical protein
MRTGDPLKKPVIGLLAALVAIAAIVAGCGSSSDTTETTASISKAEFLKQGNAICKAGNQEINEGFEKFSKENGLNHKKPTEAQFEELSETVLIPSVSSQIEEVRNLGAPEGEEGEVDEFLTNAEAALEEVEEDPSLISAEGKEEPFFTVNKEAAALGLTACGGEEGEEEGQ